MRFNGVDIEAKVYEIYTDDESCTYYDLGQIENVYGYSMRESIPTFLTNNLIINGKVNDHIKKCISDYMAGWISL